MKNALLRLDAMFIGLTIAIFRQIENKLKKVLFLFGC